MDWKGSNSAGTPAVSSLDEGSFLVHGSARIRVEVPRRIARAYNFVAEAALESSWGQAGSVQVHAGLEVPQSMQGLVPPVGANDAHPEANANPEPARFPVIVGNEATRGRFQKAFAAFRKWFPPALCYTQIVPVDEGITISLFHREDRALSRLVLEEGGKEGTGSTLARVALRESGRVHHRRFLRRVVELRSPTTRSSPENHGRSRFAAGRGSFGKSCGPLSPGTWMPCCGLPSAPGAGPWRPGRKRVS